MDNQEYATVGEQQPVSPSSAYMFDQFKQDKDSLLKIRIDNEKDLHNFELMLKGYSFDYVNQIWEKPNEKKGEKPMANSDGVKKIMFVLRTLSTKTYAFSAITKEELGDFEIDFCKQINALVYLRGRDYDIDTGNRSLLGHLIKDYGRMVYRKILNDRERMWTNTMMSYNETNHLSNNVPVKKKGIFTGRIFGGGN